MEIGNQFLGTERIDKLMRQYAVPCIISLLVGALYNIVDQAQWSNSVPRAIYPAYSAGRYSLRYAFLIRP